MQPACQRDRGPSRRDDAGSCAFRCGAGTALRKLDYKILLLLPVALDYKILSLDMPKLPKIGE